MLNLYKQLAFHSGEGPRKGRRRPPSAPQYFEIGKVHAYILRQHPGSTSSPVSPVAEDRTSGIRRDLLRIRLAV